MVETCLYILGERIMGKPISEIQPEDTIVIGITNRIKDRRLMFLETDWKDRARKRLNRLLFELCSYSIKPSNNFHRPYQWLNPDWHSYIVIETKKGYHIVGFNKMFQNYYEEMLFHFRNDLDRYHVGYSIAKGFSTLRVSNRWKEDGRKLILSNIGSIPVSKPHWETYRMIFPNMGNPKRFFDDGIEMVGYVIDEKTYKKKSKIGMIVDGKSIRTWQTKE